MGRIAIVGAGISGLSAAYWLQQAGQDVTVFEQSDRAGGVIRSVKENRYLFEAGPNSFLDNAPDTLELCDSLGLDDQLEKQSLRENPRFLFVHGGLHKVPLGPGGLMGTPILSWRAKLRLFGEPFLPGNRQDADESIASFIRRRFGEEALHHVVTPFISGVYAGDPEQLSLQAIFPTLYDLERQYGSVIGGMFRKLFSKKSQSKKPEAKRAKNLCSFKNGMETLPEAIAQQLGSRIRFSSFVVRIDQSHSGFQIITKSGKEQSTDFDSVVVAVPAYALSDLLESLIPETANSIRMLPHNRLVVFGVGFAKGQVRHDCAGFGYLIPRGQGPRILGSIWSSSIFSGRAPDRCHGFTIFVGGGLDPFAYDLSDEALGSQVLQDLEQTVGARGPFTIKRIFRYERAIPQYPVGHVTNNKKWREQCAATPGFFLTGNYFDGVSVNDCIRKGRETARQVISYLT